MAHRTVSTVSESNLSTVQLPTTIGLDLSDNVGHFQVQRGDGHVLDRGKVKLTKEHLEAFLGEWKGCRLVIEAGTHSPWISRVVSDCGLELVVANPRRVELISKSNSKTDPKDAALLAEIGRTNKTLLAPIEHRTASTQLDQAVLRARDEVVRARTSMINHVRGVMKSNGHRAPSASADSFGRRVCATMPDELKAALEPIARLIMAMSDQVKSFDEQLEDMADQKYPITKVLREIGGVGPVVSLSFVLKIEDPARFKNSRAVGPYVGLVSRKQDSGESNPQLHITKAGDRELRRLLVISANYILGCFGPDCDLRRFGLRIAGDGSNRAAKKRAKVAVARKLAVLMHHLWTHGLEYDPLYNAKKLGEIAAA